jgi:hypothetical protein
MALQPPSVRRGYSDRTYDYYVFTTVHISVRSNLLLNFPKPI